MAIELTETVLEMHFHHALMDLIRTTVGLGPGGLNFFKYSPQNETFVGFDQAYVKTSLSSDDLFRSLRDSAMTRRYRIANPDQFLGFFLQYKATQALTKTSVHTPRSFRGRHFRCKLDTIQSETTSHSQHELLFNLAQNKGALVYYACPMIFEKTDLYRPADLDKLRLPELTSCKNSYTDNAKHHIYFASETSPPLWCSLPTEGRALSPKEFAAVIRAKLERLTGEESRRQLKDLLSDRTPFGDEQPSPGRDDSFSRRLLAAVSASLTVLHVRRD